MWWLGVKTQVFRIQGKFPCSRFQHTLFSTRSFFPSPFLPGGKHQPSWPIAFRCSTHQAADVIADTHSLINDNIGFDIDITLQACLIWQSKAICDYESAHLKGPYYPVVYTGFKVSESFVYTEWQDTASVLRGRSRIGISEPSESDSDSEPLRAADQWLTALTWHFFFNFLKAHLHRDALIPRDIQLGSLLGLPSSWGPSHKPETLSPSLFVSHQKPRPPPSEVTTVYPPLRWSSHKWLPAAVWLILEGNEGEYLAATLNLAQEECDFWTMAHKWKIIFIRLSPLSTSGWRLARSRRSSMLILLSDIRQEFKLGRKRVLCNLRANNSDGSEIPIPELSGKTLGEVPNEERGAVTSRARRRGKKYMRLGHDTSPWLAAWIIDPALLDNSTTANYWKLKVMNCYFCLLQRSLYMYLLFIYRVLELSTILSITKSITNIYLEYSTKFW